MSPINLIFDGLLTKSGLYPKANTYIRERDALGVKILELYRKFEGIKDVRGDCLMGGMAIYNRQNPKHRMTDREILGNINIFVLSSQDTTKDVVGWALHYLAVDKNGQ
jgi:cytochrome P450